MHSQNNKQNTEDYSKSFSSEKRATLSKLNNQKLFKNYNYFNKINSPPSATLPKRRINESSSKTSGISVQGWSTTLRDNKINNIKMLKITNDHSLDIKYSK